MLNLVKEVHLTTRNETYKKVHIEPVVLFSILDSYMRREKETERIIGTLMGSVEDGIVTINNCFVVPHLEQPLKLGVEIHNARVKLHCEINLNDHVVGWFSTSYKTDRETMATNALIREFYHKEMDAQPVLLVLDPTVQDAKQLPLRCYVAHNIQLTERVIQYQYKPIHHVIHTHHAERLLFDRMSQRNGESVSPISELDALEKSLETQLALLDKISKHITAVTKGEIEGDSTIARTIENTLSLIPDQTDEFENMFSKGLQDILMVVYLAELTKIHLLISDQNNNNTVS